MRACYELWKDTGVKEARWVGPYRWEFRANCDSPADAKLAAVAIGPGDYSYNEVIDSRAETPGERGLFRVQDDGAVIDTTDSDAREA